MTLFIELHGGQLPMEGMPSPSALGKNTAFCDRQKNLFESSHHDFHLGIWATSLYDIHNK